MGKLSTRKPERIPSEEIQGRILSGFAGPSLSEQLKAYELALGPKNVSASSYVETEPSVMVKRNGKWVQPDRGTDIYDLTTDVIPDLPAILGGGLGAAYGGTQGAVGGATAGNVVKQRVGEALGLRDGVNETEAKLEGIGELVGPIGGKALAMVPMPNFGALTAYHGSPHLFDKFDMSKIGTGEGAQAYGHGLYFAENPNTAATYAGIAPHKINVNGEFITSGGDIHDPITKAWREVTAAFDGGHVNPFKTAKERLADKWGPKNDTDKAAIEVIKDWQSKGATVEKGGNLYEVDIPDEHIDRMLDYDKPLREQGENLQKLAELLPANDISASGHIIQDGKWVEPIDLTGQQIYQRLSAIYSPKSVSKILNDIGIPGIKYWDQFSRETGKGTRNFVLFDDSIPKILNRE